MKNIIKNNKFPNLLLYGPPGTGKTTTIINLIKDYQKENGQMNKELVIHLNASDERGIDIIRNHISQFVNSKTLFNKGKKFVIVSPRITNTVLRMSAPAKAKGKKVR